MKQINFFELCSWKWRSVSCYEAPKSNQPQLMRDTARMSWELSGQEQKIWTSRIFLISIRWNNSRKVESAVLKWVFTKGGNP